MREAHVTLPELALVAGTRAALGAGLGLLLADRLSAEQRRAIGWTLLMFGAVTTIPLAFEILGKRPSAGPALRERTESEARSEGNDLSGRRFAFPTA